MLVKCENCGGALTIPAGADRVQCGYCGSQTVLGGPGSPPPVSLRIEPPGKPTPDTAWLFGLVATVPLIIAVVEGVKYRGISRDVVAALIGALILDLVALGAWLAYKKEVRFRARALPERGTLIALRTLSDGKTGLDLSVEMAGRQPWLVTSVSKIPEIVLPRLVSGFSLPVLVDPENLERVEVQGHLLYWLRRGCLSPGATLTGLIPRSLALIGTNRSRPAKTVTVIPYCSPQNASPVFSSPGQLLGVLQEDARTIGASTRG
ncbi:MAG TPA: hypothetical protein PKL73_06905 [Polyangiaceae bacterium]|nr:hypothetical protein [Polyangiaceae bacterium]HNZ23055.1 hypothetical protein [Polyangiaceae bacterium]HOD21168.1 hypothetical protein [Polyangiaceae bacterium]HOH01805.1 hypothetical protein [Polyangiaceae bacterium]HOR34056.1 hypothetical protein [Polyangiaceae bacterium]